VRQFLQYAALGIASGSVYALLACGLVVIYRGAGLLNLAHGAYAMVGAFTFYQLNALWHLPVAVSFLLAVAFVAMLGALTNLLIMRQLRTASGIVRLIATLGVLLVFEGAVLIIKGPSVFIVKQFLPQDVYHLDGIRIGASSLALLLIAIAVVIGLGLFSRRTQIGLATTAVSENERGAAALGWSPDAVATLTWALGCGLAAVAGILIVPSIGLQATSLTLIVVAAMAAALLGDFSSFSLTLVAGLLIGVAQAETSRYSIPGLADSVPFLATMLILVARGSRLPIRGHVISKLPRLGTGVPRYRVIAVVTAMLLALMIFVFPEGLNSALANQAAVGLVLLSIVVLTGYAGQISLGQFALAGLGALFAGRVAQELHWPFELALLMGVLGAALVGGIFAFPALRTRGLSLAVVTLGLGLGVQEVILFNSNITGSNSGTPVGTPSLFGWDVGFIDHPDRYAILCVIAFVIGSLAVANIRRSRAGRRLVAIRTNERAASALGISVLESKVYAFMLSSALAGLGGVLIGFRGPSVVYTAFDPLTSINAVGYAVIGGIGFVTGPIVGSGFAAGSVGSWVLDQFGSLDYWLMLIGGLVTLQILIQNPNGLVEAGCAADPLSRHLVRKIRERRARVTAQRQQQRNERMRAAAEPVGAATVERPAPAVLELHGVTVGFRGVVALDGLDLTVRTGEVVGLIGPNGAGKTTAIDAITGFVSPRSGSILLNGVPIDTWSVHRRSRAGLSRSFQGLELFDDLSVFENLQAASDPRDRLAYLSGLIGRRSRSIPPIARAAVSELDLQSALPALPTDLAFGKRRLVAIARALATGPSILLLDEPAAGLDTAESKELSTLIKRLAKEWGIGVLLIEHDMNVIMNSCDHVAVIDFGHMIASGAPDQVRTDPAVIAAYLGSTHETVAEPSAGPETVTELPAGPKAASRIGG
jgi:sulfate-transporting ATPase